MRDREIARARTYCLCLCLCVHAGAFKDQNIESPGARFSDSYEPLIWLLETVLWKSSTHCWTISPAPTECFCCFVCFFNVCDCFAYLYVCVHVCLVSTEATRYQTPWNWSLSCHWVLRLKPGSSGRATSSLSHYALSSPQRVFSEEKRKAIISPQNKVDVSTMMNVLKMELESGLAELCWGLLWKRVERTYFLMPKLAVFPRE